MAVTITQENFQELLTNIMGNEFFFSQLKEKLGATLKEELGQPASGPAHEKDKNKVLLNDYTFRRMDKFTGAEGTWQEWSFNMSMTVTQVHQELGEALEEMRLVKSPVSADMFTDVDSPFTKVSDEMIKSYSAALYGVMCSLTGGEANAIVRSVSQKLDAKKCGFTAFYALNVRFNPKTPARKLQFFAQVVNPAQVKNVKDVPMATENGKQSMQFL